MTKKCIFQRVIFIVILLFAAGNSAWAKTIPREAQKHMNRRQGLPRAGQHLTLILDMNRGTGINK